MKPACILIWLTTTSVATAAAPKLNYLFPPGGQRGQTVEVTANGSWDTWPVTAWTDRPGLQVSAESDKGKLKISVDPQAEPGVIWLRLTNKDGATSVKPFVVGTLPELNEAEPNDDPTKPQLLEKSAVVNGRLGKREDVDTFAVQLTKGQTLVASMQANSELGSAVDGVLQVCSANYFVLDQCDDARGVDPMVAFTAPADGRYLVRAFGFPVTPDSSISFAGNDAFLYRLTVSTGGYIDHTFPMAVSRTGSTEVRFAGWNVPENINPLVVPETGGDFVRAFHADLAGSVLLPVITHPSIVETPENGSNAPQPITIPATITGTIGSPIDEDVFTFAAKKGQALVLDVESDELGFLLDGALNVKDANGKVLAEADDARRARDPQLNFSAPADGEYRVTIRDVYGHGGPRYVYRLTALEAKPDFELKVTGDTFSVKPGESVEVSIAIDRNKGFDQEIEISAMGLPVGITSTPLKSQKEGATAKSVKLVLQANADAQSGAFGIVGKTGGEMPLERRARLTGDGIPATLSQAWVTVAR